MSGPKGFQFVWWWRRWWKLWPSWPGPYPKGGQVYRWRFVIGPLEIRRWA